MEEVSSSKVFHPIPRRLDSNQNLSPILTSGPMNESPSRTQSALNLTSSTLKGIFSPAVYESEQESVSTPVGTVIPKSRKNNSLLGVPIKIRSIARPSKKKRVIDTTIRAFLLFITGMCYGFLIQNLQDKPQLFPYEVANNIQKNISRGYLFLWGISGVAIGSLLPRVDASFSLGNSLKQNSPKESTCNTNDNSKMGENNILRQGSTPVIRSVGAFIGISFALRKLPWSSTFQASLALCLVNPVLWYLIDRSKSGFFLSSVIGTSGTVLLLILKSKMMVYPTLQSPIKTYYASLIPDERGKNAVGLDLVGKENLEDAIWILSVLFCSCICFGNIGRRLALNRKV
ncbi:Protein NSG1 [Erysiphe neolycopersici]|uniref:Protein NSG1 n=1 Tax=Erysiphe neolycopersici TaxID=212602 RepID=A0A420HDY8_9PEZI|nr:Protein NSG1 [Erysiphe neolycopersici]